MLCEEEDEAVIFSFLDETLRKCLLFFCVSPLLQVIVDLLFFGMFSQHCFVIEFCH